MTEKHAHDFIAFDLEYRVCEVCGLTQKMIIDLNQVSEKTNWEIVKEGKEIKYPFDYLTGNKKMAEPTTTTGTYLYIYPDCPYRNICSDNGSKCETCANNPKRSYYRLVEPYIPYIPYLPYYPYWQPIPYIWYNTTSSTVTDESHYQST